MKKIPTLFVRKFIGNHEFYLINEVTLGCEWVLNGEGVATRKYDGTCCLIKDGRIHARYDYKLGRNLPVNAIPCQAKPDEITGHFPHWVQCDENAVNYKWHLIAFRNQPNLEDGTYELCGEHFQSNIDKLVEHGDILVKHGITILNVERNFEGIEKYLTENNIEGIVFHRENGDMCKIKRTDFGLSWGRSTRKIGSSLK